MPNIRMKNRAAVSLARRRWAKATTEDRQLSAQNGKLGGRARDPDRCPCDKMTAARARKRNHKCQSSARTS
jgi:hypothetical protein